MKVLKGEKLKIIESRKGTYLAIAEKNFDTEKDEWYPVVVDQELVEGLSNVWYKGDGIPCRNGHCRIEIRKNVRTVIERDPVPIELWGKDHWSTLAYLETLIVDHKGKIEKMRMRCSTVRHPRFTHSGLDGGKFPTRLKGKLELEDHDDYDCIKDMVKAGLLQWKMTPTSPGTVKFLKKGFEIAAQLRQYKAGGGQFALFSVDKELSDEDVYLIKKGV